MKHLVLRKRPAPVTQPQPVEESWARYSALYNRLRAAGYTVYLLRGDLPCAIVDALCVQLEALLDAQNGDAAIAQAIQAQITEVCAPFTAKAFGEK
jgi:hypothetical protein